jgi:hypothetical protein
MSDTPDTKAAEPLFTEYVDSNQLKIDLEISLTDLTGAMQKQSAMLVHYGTMAVRARHQFDRYKAAIEILEAVLDSRHRTILKEENPKTTETQIRAAVLTDPAYKAGQVRLINAQQQYKLADVAVSGFESRKDMLLQIARDAARESAGPLRVVANQTSRERLLDAMEKNAAAAS